MVRGFEDPDLLQVDRESPTLSSLGRNLLLTECAQRNFDVCVGDIRAAFLSGDNTEVDREIFAYPPAEAKALLGMSDTQVFRIVKAIYGFFHAPKRWFESLSRFLLQDGWSVHDLDQCLFKWIDGSGTIGGYLGLHVDDVITGGSGDYYLQKMKGLRERYPFGSWVLAKEETAVYCDCELSQEPSGRLFLRQERFSLSVDEISIPKERQSHIHDLITDEERRELRRGLGALSWRATQSAPWLLATVSHPQGAVTQGTVAELLSAKKLVRLNRRYCHSGLTFEPQLLNPVVVTFTDASWASRTDGSSQGGQITVLMEHSAIEGGQGKFSVLAWSSRRLKRVARSSTSAEAQMVGNGLDFHEFVKLAYLNMSQTHKMDLRRADEYSCQFESFLVSDSKNVYDALVKVETSGLHMEEKRTAVELLGIKERLGQARVTIRWVDGDQELADSLTKPWTYEQLSEPSI